MKFKFTGQLKMLTDKAKSGNSNDVDYIMDKLSVDSTFAMTRYVDFALSLVGKNEGI